MSWEEIYGFTKFEQDLLNDAKIMRLVLSDEFAQHLYATLCNTTWVKGNETFSPSWRYSGGIVAYLRNFHAKLNEDYLDFYCSGSEGTQFPEVLDEITRLGWMPG